MTGAICQRRLSGAVGEEGDEGVDQAIVGEGGDFFAVEEFLGDQEGDEGAAEDVGSGFGVADGEFGVVLEVGGEERSSFLNDGLGIEGGKFGEAGRLGDDDSQQVEEFGVFHVVQKGFGKLAQQSIGFAVQCLGLKNVLHSIDRDAFDQCLEESLLVLEVTINSLFRNACRRRDSIHTGGSVALI